MHIDSYSFGSITIDGKTYTHDILIAGETIKDWWRIEGHLLQTEDLKEVWDYKPDILFIGQGASGIMKISDSVKEKCSEMDIELVSGNTDKIADMINKVSFKGKIAAGLHLTC